MDIPDSFDEFIDSIPDDLPDDVRDELASQLLRFALNLTNGHIAVIVYQHDPECDSRTCEAGPVGGYHLIHAPGMSDEGVAHLVRLTGDLFERDSHARRS